ncbi:facilitated trehalose transporter Tret1-like [Manduca sexta]|uniref:facilitated trehalose transporter Tret1-like n=1 Tax=Manduca sexta TaxID=7130 RepID=UPI00188EDB42|nr:facilitated trehalose transporter Tret1-like [Manduca sexta]
MFHLFIIVFISFRSCTADHVCPPKTPRFTSTCPLHNIFLFQIGLGVFFKLKDSGPISGAMNFLPIVSLILVVFGYSAGVGSLVWVLTAELFEDSARGIGICLSSVLSYISLFLMTKYFEQMVTAIGPAVTYWIFSVNGVIFTLFILFCIPETKGKSFSEIQIALGAKDRNIAEEKTKC